jgi:hypothetical protein
LKSVRDLGGSGAQACVCTPLSYCSPATQLFEREEVMRYGELKKFFYQEVVNVHFSEFYNELRQNISSINEF